MRRYPKRFTMLAFLVSTGLALTPGIAAAADNGEYASWARSGSSGAWQAAGTPAAGFPVASIASNATSLTTPTGASTFLGPATPPGLIYGSSQNNGYVNISTATGVTPSTSTVTFASPTPAKDWAFILGDLDADVVTISATDAAGDPISPADLGFEGTFNYCAYSPKPSSCTGPGPFDHVPTWSADTSSLIGDGDDTSGAAAWFQPTVAVKTLTFTFARLNGIPIFQFWLATKAVPVMIPIKGTTDECRPSVELDDADGAPVMIAGGPVVVQAGPDGTVVLPAVVDGDYQLHMTVPGCGKPIDNPVYPITVDVEKGPVTVPPGTFAIEVPELADTGQHTLSVLGAAGAALVAGLALVVGARRRRLLPRL
ncbi:MAG: LPXTG cell wall anchor domain-containing protein [Hamadaea sp.]|nr:LPXTG cell wall anchor domain-containing protein [Hamadaea sp.]